MNQTNNPSLGNVVSPGQSTPYFKSNMSTIFYVVWGIFISSAVCVYFAHAEGLLPLSETMLYGLIALLVVVGVFIADRIQFVFDN